MGKKRAVALRVCAVLAAVGAVIGVSPVALATDALAVTVGESWGGTLPSRVQPGQTVTLLLNFSQSTHVSGVQVPGTSFDVWSDSATAFNHVQVQCLDPSNGSWVSVPVNNGDAWSCSFASAVTISPGVTYRSGVRFTIDASAPGGTWNVAYPGIDGVITQVAVPPGELRIPQSPTRSFTFKDAGAVAAPTTTYTRPAAVPETTRPSTAAATHSVAPATSTTSRPAAMPTTSAAPSPTRTASAMTATAAPTPSPTASVEAVSDARSEGPSYLSIAVLALLFAASGAALYRWRAHGRSNGDSPS